MLLAHRGLHGLHPENSPAAFAALPGSGLDGAEFDVRLAADGAPVVVHDATLERTHGDPRAVASLTAAQLEPLGVPTLATVLALLPPPLLLDVELKVEPNERFCAVVRAARGSDADGAVFSSFEPAHLARLAALEPSWPTWLNAAVGEPLHAARASGYAGVAVERGMLGATLRAARGEEVATWTLGRAEQLELLEAPGLVAACLEGAAVAAALERFRA